jgi:integrase
MAEFIAERRKARGKKPGSRISPATINRDLRHVKAALRTAAEWGCLERVPKVKFETEPKTLPRYITPEHFAAIYAERKSATLPNEMHVPASEWWQGLLVFAQMTGWRIGEILSLEWADVDLGTGCAITRAENNKGKRTETVALHPVVIDHIRPLKTFHDNVFPWEHELSKLYDQFAAIQDAAAIKLPCRIEREHECTDACHRYGFHDERRAFATMNAANMTREALQALMRHQSSLTTERYINFARQMAPAVANLHVPEVLKLNAAS